MSTVLRPVGPRPPGVYWLRRLIPLIILVVIIVLLAKACSGGGSSPKKKPVAKQSTGATVSPSPSVSAAQVSACDPTTLTLTLSTDADSYAAGSPAQLMGVLTNPGTSACTLAQSAMTENWTVKSGSVKIWTTKGCATSTTTKQITLQPGATKQISVTWPGSAQTSDCATGEVAQAGEYTLNATLDGVKGKIAVFHITS